MPSPARVRQFARLQQPLILRYLRAAARVLRLKISRVHRSYPPRLIADVYLLTAVLLCLFLAGRLFMPREAPENLVPIMENQETQDAAFSRLSALISDRYFEEAGVLADELESLYPDDVRLFVSKGIIAAAAGDSEAALAAFTRADALKPGSVTVTFNLAETEFFMGRYSEAEAHYRSILLAQPKNMQAIFRIYLCARQQNRYAEAARMFQMASQSRYSIEWYYIHAADAFIEGRTQEGKALLDKARSVFGRKTAAYDRTLLHLELISK